MTAGTLVANLANRIAQDGPLSIADFMDAVTKHYYDRGDVFGRAGDFITAPDISQTFGELIGLWCVTAWQALGQPSPCLVVECGPGRGTLLSDAVRAINEVAPDFLNVAEFHLVERSTALRDIQRDKLSYLVSEWHDDLSTLPPGPLLIIGNEFLDALPIRQFEKTASGWCERQVAHGPGGFAFTTAALPTDAIDHGFDDVPIGSIIEHSDAVVQVTQSMAELCVSRPGIVLMIDYGHTRTDIGDTLQAVRDHSYHPVLSEPGTADLTAHVDFALVAQSARSVGAKVFGPLEQGLWLRRIGATVREAQLCDGKSEADVEAIRSGVRRLIDPDGMGTLFKVIALAPENSGPLAGFEADI